MVCMAAVFAAKSSISPHSARVLALCQLCHPSPSAAKCISSKRFVDRPVA